MRESGWGMQKGKRKLPQFNAWPVGGGILSGVEFQFIQWDRQGSQSLNYVTTKLSQLARLWVLKGSAKKVKRKIPPNLDQI